MVYLNTSYSLIGMSTLVINERGLHLLRQLVQEQVETPSHHIKHFQNIICMTTEKIITNGQSNYPEKKDQRKNWIVGEHLETPVHELGSAGSLGAEGHIKW